MSFQSQNKHFFLDLDSFENQIDEDIVKMHREVAFLVLQRLLSHGRYVGASPVGNMDLWQEGYWKERAKEEGYSGGRFISNWRVDINKKDVSIIDIVDAGGKESWSQMKDLNNLKPFQVIWISNNLPYAVAVMEQGHSSQTPEGTIALTIAEVKQTIQAKYGA